MEFWTSSAAKKWKGPGVVTPTGGFTAGLSTQAALSATLAGGGGAMGTQFGVSFGGGISTVEADFSPQYIRCYETRGVTPSPNTWANSAAASVGAGFGIVYSFQPDMSVCAVRNTSPGSAYMGIINAWRAILLGSPDNFPAEVRVIIDHEANGSQAAGAPGGSSPADYAAAIPNLRTDLFDWVNAPAQGRTNPVLLDVNLMGFLLLTHSGTLIAQSYFTTAVMTAADAVTFDTYQPTVFQLCADFSSTNGVPKPFAIPEIGNGTTADHNDTDQLNWMKANLPGLVTMRHAPIYALWYNGGHNSLTGGSSFGAEPNSIAYLKNACITGRPA